MFLCLTVLDMCIINSFSLSLFPCTMNLALYLFTSVPGCLIDNTNLPPGIFACFGSWFLSTYWKDPLVERCLFHCL